MAAATALVTDFDDPADPHIDPRPNALVLYNPGLELASPNAIRVITRVWGNAIVDHLRDLSPIDHLDRGLPPTIIFAGTADQTVPPASHQEFCRRARALKASVRGGALPGCAAWVHRNLDGSRRPRQISEDRVLGSGYEPSHRRLPHQVRLAAAPMTCWLIASRRQRF